MKVKFAIDTFVNPLVSIEIAPRFSSFVLFQKWQFVKPIWLFSSETDE